MPELNLVTIVFIYIAFFGFLLFLLAFGELEGGSWQTIAQEVSKFSLLIIGFITAILVIWGLAGRR